MAEQITKLKDNQKDFIKKMMAILHEEREKSREAVKEVDSKKRELFRMEQGREEKHRRLLTSIFRVGGAQNAIA